MKKRNTRHEQRIKKLIVACVLCAIILTISTYAWFIGMKTVNVSAFEVEIATTESLSLSLDGEKFSEKLTVNKEAISTGLESAYSDNTNTWGGTGLIPVSTIGKIDTASNRMVLFEKGSLTASNGGYRLMASRVKNTASDGKEAPGYVAFDLFIKNLSGTAYYAENNVGNEEAIYLTPDSKATVGELGKKDSGIENSVRVAFAQIGRVKADTTKKEVQGITCTTQSKVTGICASRPAQIWEPNDKKHVKNAINWYTTSCKTRSSASEFAEACTPISDGTAYKTFAVAGEITEKHGVDVYDGDYNTYQTTVSKEVPGGITEDGKLYAYDTFTDTEKDLKGNERPTFMTLAPNSITKVRVYVYIEGQDVDNYDFASLGKQIKVNFGFTKERYYGEDIQYNEETPKGPELSPEVSARPTPAEEDKAQH